MLLPLAIVTSLAMLPPLFHLEGRNEHEDSWSA
jgi:hypothetical protein